MRKRKEEKERASMEAEGVKRRKTRRWSNGVARGKQEKDVPSFVSAGTAVGGYVTCWSSW